MPSNLNCLTDSQGHRYDLEFKEQDGGLYWLIFKGECKVGYALCRQEEASLRINDLKITDVYIQPSPRVFLFLRRILGILPVKVSCRRKGLGSALLETIIQWTRQEGLESIVGYLAEFDVKEYPDLHLWYERHGFKYEETPNRDQFVGKVSLLLNKRESVCKND